jgi:hypothetical protein
MYLNIISGIQCLFLLNSIRWHYRKKGPIGMLLCFLLIVSSCWGITSIQLLHTEP